MVAFGLGGLLCCGMPAMAVANPSASEVEAIHFPREVSNNLGMAVIHAPQIESWENFERITGASAIEASLPGSEQKHIGAFQFRAETSNDLDNRIVTIHDTEIVSISFPGTTSETASSLDALVRSAVRTYPQQVPLDLALRSVQHLVTAPTGEGLSNTPPEIFVSQKPAILVIIDGDTARVPIEKLRLEYAINTNWDLFFYTKKDEWYLLNGKQWLTTSDVDSGPWKQTKRLPKDFKKLPNSRNWAAASANVPPAKSSAAVPKVYVSHKPAELLLIGGEPEFREIPGTSLLQVTNTESDLFKYQNRWYYLVSGRWFAATGLDQLWAPMRELPEEFANIPADDDAAHVRVAIAGTEEATLAVLEAQIPRKATVSRESGADVTVIYAGEPIFVGIQGTSLQRAANADSDVILSGSTYYLCKNAVWYEGYEPGGPWRITDTIPAEIYTIPPTDPVYHTTYVKVYETSPVSVTFGFYGGYYGMYSYYGVPVYGTGYYYSPYFYYGYGYPVYYPYPYSYGASSWYNPRTGSYGRGASYYGPYGGYGRGSVYNPRTGTYARGEAVWDSNEIAGRAAAYNPRTGTGVATNRYANEDGAWGESVIARGDQWVATQGQFSGDRADVDFQTSRGTSGNVTRQKEGFVTTGTATAQRGDRSVSTTTARSGDTTVVDLSTSGGASGQITRTRDGDTMSSTGTIQRDGQTITTEGSMSRDGARVDLESSSGASGAVGRRGGSNYAAGTSAEGDLYVGRDQSVYKRTDDGWSKRNNGQWESASRNTQRTTQRSSASTSSQRQLNRDHRARSGGYNSHRSRSTQRSRPQMSRPGGFRRR